VATVVGSGRVGYTAAILAPSRATTVATVATATAPSESNDVVATAAEAP
jgi:thioredoxin reductase